MAGIPDVSGSYCTDVENIRENEYPLLKGTTYLDHAGTTPYAASLIKLFSQEMTNNLFGNPHSASESSQLSTNRIDDVRLQVLRFFNANPEDFDVVFVANATAGIKLVAEAMRDFHSSDGFWYGYHVDSHTSLVGVRNVAKQGQRCFSSDHEVAEWIGELEDRVDASTPVLFAYPGQSNMSGRRLPLDWCGEITRICCNMKEEKNIFTLYDAASLASTSPLDLGDVSSAPDFTVISFYKIFGFPDLGALIVRRETSHLFKWRKYFGGGTVGMVLCLGEQWQAKKDTSLHDQLEDGTLPFHSIIALSFALKVHELLYGSMTNISRHAGHLAEKLADSLVKLKHANGTSVCVLYKGPGKYTETSVQGPIISFNLKTSSGRWVGKSEVEKLAAVKNIQIRSGTLCNPGGMAYYLGLKPDEMLQNYNAGQRCGDDNDIISGRPTGGLRVSLGAMTSIKDVETFLDFIREYYVNYDTLPSVSLEAGTRSVVSITASQPPATRFYIQKLCLYPIKSCAAFVISEGTEWVIKPEGLAWDREWCLIHQGTGVALNQKRYPRMALIRPTLDLNRGIMRVTLLSAGSTDMSNNLEISLHADDPVSIQTELNSVSTSKSSTVCGDRVSVRVYQSPEISSFFSAFLDVPCTLARFPPLTSARYSKPTSQPPTRSMNGTTESCLTVPMPGSFPDSMAPLAPSPPSSKTNKILLSNESPMLLISRSSVNKLNEMIKFSSNPSTEAKEVDADVFRANIIAAEDSSSTPSSSRLPAPSSTSASCENPYIEDMWTRFHIGDAQFIIIGPCQRCQMVCINQLDASRSEEPYSTLVKTRKTDGKVFFGKHVCLSREDDQTPHATVKVGDTIVPFYD
ncbi:hypothetical protein FQN57_005692 [Myotisia sp. PD_48]|nr:hypothetical protein FQN57_005692 [Myotisia sp. PD_48]